jgi:hypothetical protein
MILKVLSTSRNVIKGKELRYQLDWEWEKFNLFMKIIEIKTENRGCNVLFLDKIRKVSQKVTL